ncbi:aldo/keto reductase [uncultured Hyphomonas sp.]|uniref:aldo/keto reductase n=1 Tax=uncultured Hyphomonas sp. TaxID=225298 RepID=UPI002AAA9BA1|nr:aldo/keto reductase [uncultured Hyphomonas sp.]
MTDPNANLAGSITIGGDMEVARLGYGSMRITGPGAWGPPKDREEALRTLRRLPNLGVSFIDTADSYGPEISEALIQEALAPFGRIRVATKAGNTRPGPDRWIPRGDPEYLIAQAHRSRDLLGVEQIDLWQLHRVDPRVPMDEQFSAIRTLLDAGVIRHAGLSEVNVSTIEIANRYFPVASVQNRYNLADREHEAVLDYCEGKQIAFIPWFPLAAGRLTGPDSPLARIAVAHNASPGQIALAWLLHRSPVILPIPGTSKVAHLEENVRAGAIRLSPDEFDRLDAMSRR